MSAGDWPQEGLRGTAEVKPCGRDLDVVVLSSSLDAGVDRFEDVRDSPSRTGESRISPCKPLALPRHEGDFGIDPLARGFALRKPDPQAWSWS